MFETMNSSISESSTSLESPAKSFLSFHASFVTEKLKPVTDELLDTASDRSCNSRRRPSQLELSVNDSQSGKRYEDTYDQGDLLGEGGYAMVYRCKHKQNGSFYAVKEVFHNEYDGANSLKDEIAALKCVRENVCLIVRLHDVFVEVDRTYLVMEEMEGGDLLDRISEKGPYAEGKARRVFRRILEAIWFCHKKGIAHRDIKPENVLLVSPDDDTTVKLCDFGCAKLVGDKPYALKTMAGSPHYAAPEVFEHTDRGGYGKECDLWSAGVMLYVLFSAMTPFEGSVYEISRQVTEGDWVFDEKVFRKVPRLPKDLITNLLKVDVKERYSADQALDCRWLRRPELNRSSSDKYLTKNKKADTLPDISSTFHQSLPAFFFDHRNDDSTDDSNTEELSLSPPVPMHWIAESPRVLKIKREMPLTTRRLNAKPKFGANKLPAKPKLGDSFAVLNIGHESFVFGEGSGGEADLQGSLNSSINELSHESLKFHCSIPDLMGEEDSTIDD